jgi:O-antigen ligase
MTNNQLRKQEKALWLLLLGATFFIPISIFLSESLIYFYSVPVWAYALVRYRDSRVFRSPFFWPVVLFVALAVAASAWGVNPSGCLRKCHRLSLLATIFMMGDAFRADQPSHWANVRLAVMLFVAGASLQGLFDLVRIPLEVAKNREWMYLGNMRVPQMELVSFCFLLAMLSCRPSKYPRVLLAVLLLISVAGMVIHLKRGVWFAAGFAAVLMGLLTRRPRVAIIVLAVLLVALPVALTRKPITARFEKTRVALWTEVASGLLRDYPWGVGYTGTRYELLQKYTEHMSETPQHLHNNIIQVAAELGWLGLAVWLAWIVVTFWMLLAAYRSLRGRAPEDAAIALGALGAFCGLLVHGMVEYNFGDSEILMVFAFLMGLSDVLWQSRPQSQ